MSKAPKKEQAKKPVTETTYKADVPSPEATCLHPQRDSCCGSPNTCTAIDNILSNIREQKVKGGDLIKEYQKLLDALGKREVPEDLEAAVRILKASNLIS